MRKKESKKCMIDADTQTEHLTSEAEVMCNIPFEQTNTNCSNCFARNNPNLVMEDHMYNLPSTKNKDIVGLTKSFSEKQNQNPCYNSTVSDQEYDFSVDFETPTKIVIKIPIMNRQIIQTPHPVHHHIRQGQMLTEQLTRF